MTTHITSHQLSHRNYFLRPYIIPQILHRSSRKNGEGGDAHTGWSERRDSNPQPQHPKCCRLTIDLLPDIKYSPSTVLIVYHNNVPVSRDIVKHPILHHHLHHLHHLQPLQQAKLHHQRPYRHMENNTHKQYIAILH